MSKKWWNWRKKPDNTKGDEYPFVLNPAFLARAGAPRSSNGGRRSWLQRRSSSDVNADPLSPQSSQGYMSVLGAGSPSLGGGARASTITRSWWGSRGRSSVARSPSFNSESGDGYLQVGSPVSRGSRSIFSPPRQRRSQPVLPQIEEEDYSYGSLGGRGGGGASQIPSAIDIRSPQPQGTGDINDPIQTGGGYHPIRPWNGGRVSVGEPVKSPQYASAAPDQEPEPDQDPRHRQTQMTTPTGRRTFNRSVTPSQRVTAGGAGYRHDIMPPWSPWSNSGDPRSPGDSSGTSPLYMDVDGYGHMDVDGGVSPRPVIERSRGASSPRHVRRGSGAGASGADSDAGATPTNSTDQNLPDGKKPVVPSAVIPWSGKKSKAMISVGDVMIKGVVPDIERAFHTLFRLNQRYRSGENIDWAKNNECVKCVKILGLKDNSGENLKKYLETLNKTFPEIFGGVITREVDGKIKHNLSEETKIDETLSKIHFRVSDKMPPNPDVHPTKSQPFIGKGRKR